ncbi:lipoteichoic acid stability factor AuxB [Staphylococcus argenteus]|uniref:lipoteichoic acid stability factor AuxB n=1 Tax=Staphylococcus argenteus TaxID=985002 RepID=UPI000234006C|nr:DUF4064 domain-containing protein [Staphylococcus argenteus]MBE2130177.1 DUF4064 domain-containing protein [Staphylococcus argenteus]MBE2133939.1 DUF4064 domain-containing protein [Staphylococcus argenteus]MBE2145743.1 DUF4064 domain-containing protein [Staphylococcus argenteus]MBE2162313.1 DUF4064 domain-containing protein [Staphylococcus argenteus]MCG9799016.1 DUF4064 domain-containing protein [Staphylococcus argenteus]
MTGEQFTQIKRPVSRLTEKVLGWLCWVMLLVLTIITMFIALVSFSNNTSIANLENTLNNNAFIQQLLAGNGYNTTQFVIWLQNGIWAIIVYFIVCLLISFLALISMNIRILSGFLFLISAFVTIPLILLIVTLIIPILFFIIAMMMFIRKDKVEMVGPQYYEGYNEPYYDYREPVYERPQPKDEYYDEPKHESEAEKAHTVYDQEKDKYDQFPKRAVESEYNTVETSEGEPSVLSRQAKYKQKSTEELGIEDDGYYAEPEVDPKELKAQQKREKAEIKAKKKEKRKAYNQRMKERRKNQPSAVSQRRMNFEERRQIYNNDITEERNSSEVKDNNKHE